MVSPGIAPDQYLWIANCEVWIRHPPTFVQRAFYFISGPRFVQFAPPRTDLHLLALTFFLAVPKGRFALVFVTFMVSSGSQRFPPQWPPSISPGTAPRHSFQKNTDRFLIEIETFPAFIPFFIVSLFLSRLPPFSNPKVFPYEEGSGVPIP